MIQINGANGSRGSAPRHKWKGRPVGRPFFENQRPSRPRRRLKSGADLRECRDPGHGSGGPRLVAVHRITSFLVVEPRRLMYGRAGLPTSDLRQTRAAFRKSRIRWLAGRSRPHRETGAAARDNAPQCESRIGHSPTTAQDALSSGIKTKPHSRGPSAHGLDPWGKPGSTGQPEELLTSGSRHSPGMAPFLMQVVYRRGNVPPICWLTQTGWASHRLRSRAYRPPFASWHDGLGYQARITACRMVWGPPTG